MQDGVDSFPDALQKNWVCTQVFPVLQLTSGPEVWTVWGAFLIPVHGLLEDMQVSQLGTIARSSAGDWIRGESLHFPLAFSLSFAFSFTPGKGTMALLAVAPVIFTPEISGPGLRPVGLGNLFLLLMCEQSV